MRCSWCKQHREPADFPPRKNTRGRSYICRACKRVSDMRRYWIRRCAVLRSRLRDAELKLEACEVRLRTGRDGVCQSRTDSMNDQ